LPPRLVDGVASRVGDGHRVDRQGCSLPDGHPKHRRCAYA
jgi:hypothetical protein